MTSDEFLAELQSLVGGEVNAETPPQGLVLNANGLARSPRLYTHLQGHAVKFDFIIESELRLEVNTRPPARLRLRREGLVSRALSVLGIVCDRKTGDMVFDDTYLIDNASQAWAAAALNDEVRELVAGLEPLAVLELTDKEYRCLKSVDLADYSPQRAVEDMETLIRIVEITRGLDGESAAR